jgi:hypothetical protein
MVFAAAWNVALVEPAATVAADGTVTELLLLEIAIAAPPVGAAWDSDTVQFDDAPEVREVGEHWSPVTLVVVVTLIVPPDPVILASVPFASVPNTFVMESVSEVALLLDESVAVTTATTPLPIAVAFAPEATQTRAPTPLLQLRFFPAAESTDPALAVRDVTLAVG